VTAAIIVTAACLLASACFSGFENGMLALRRARLDHAAGEGKATAVLMRRFLDNPGLMLGTILLGNNLANVFAAIYFDEIVQRVFGTSAVYTSIASLMLTFFVLVFGEISPKVWFRQAPMQRCGLLVFPMYALYVVMMPAVKVLNGVAQLVSRLVGGGPAGQDRALIRDEFRTFVLEGSREGVLDAEAARILDSALGYTGETAGSLMTPIDKARTMPATLTLREAVNLAEDLRTSRFPIVSPEDAENAWVGLFSAYDAIFTVPPERWDDETVTDHFRPLVTVPAGAGIDRVLRIAHATRTPLLAVLDDGGKTVGVVSVRDVLRPLFGELEV
jgi:CBS domain containing-hemolysin-like protein